MGADMVHYSVQPRAELLLGHALHHKARVNHPGKWERFEEASLPYHVKNRFRELFAKKTEWTMEEIKPYLAGLVRAGHDMDKLLLKNTRMLDGTNPETGEKIHIIKPRHISYSSRR